jgi:hypothetical protein
MGQGQTCVRNDFLDLRDHIGETVTIFTTSGGASGSGFTGVILSVNNCFVRLAMRIGPAPGCALGNECNRDFEGRRNGLEGGGFRGFCGGRGHEEIVNNVGSIVDIPLDRIAAVVFNSI